jgi:ferric-dicitrate binding protein FerR (iron transport regulator)
MTPAADTVVAVSERVQGQPLVLRGNGHGDRRWPLAAASSVTADELVATDSASRAALRTADGSSVRIDRASRVRFVGPGVIEVLDGAAYVATSDGSRGFEIRTPLGIVRDVGTQFEVRVSGSSVRLRVRTGTVTIRRGASVTPAGAGTEATVTSAGIVVRQVPAFGTEWSWTSALAVPFAIDGRPLRAFLEHIVAEEGWRLRYADRELGDAAGRIILHGSVEGLGAEDALRVALATSGLRYRLAAGELLVFRASDER